MMYFLSKMVDRFLDPISLIWLVLLITCVRAVLKKESRQAYFTGELVPVSYTHLTLPTKA